jgi:hypothetical protein
MRTTIAASEFFGTTPDGDRRRLTVAVGTPAQSGDGAAWRCKVAIADVLRPTQVDGDDSFMALARAVARVRKQLADLEAEGWRFYRDPGCERSLDFDHWGAPPS